MSLKKIVTDGWVNLLTGLGQRQKDRAESTFFSERKKLNAIELEQLYRQDGFAKKIIEIFPDEMVRQWFRVEGDPDNLILARLEEIDAKNKIRELLLWGRLFGGAIAVLGVDDGGNLDDPINYRNIKNLEFIHVFDKNEVSWTVTDTYQNPNSIKYGLPEFYRVSPAAGGTFFVVHESRVLKVIGENLPIRSMINNNGWGDSALQSCYEQLRNLNITYNSAANIVQDFIQSVISIENLADLVSAGKSDIIYQRLNILDASKSINNTLLLDANENYSKQASSIGGLDQMIDRQALALASVTKIPYSFLMGEPPSGLQSTGQADIRMFYDSIKSDQENLLQPLLEKIAKILFYSSDMPFGKKEPENWKVVFNPLWQKSDVEDAAYKKSIAETDAIYISTGVLDPAEVAYSRFGTGSFSPDTLVDMSLREKLSAANFEPQPIDFSAQNPINNDKKDAEEKISLEKEYLEILKKIVEN